MEDRTAKENLLLTLLKLAVLAAWSLMAAVFMLFYWSSIMHLFHVWATQEDYGHGFVVPIFALVLLWLRRDMIIGRQTRGSWWGLPVLVLWAAIRLTSVYFNYGSLPEYSMLVFFAGVAIFVGGWMALKWSWPSIVFLVFMIPLPGATQGSFSQMLQSISTHISVYVIQTLGIPAIAQGHVINVNDRLLNVETACSGLRMLMLFFAMCVGMAFVARRPLWEKLVMIVSAVPIALASNAVRIILTAVICEIARQWPSLINIDNAQEFIHNWVGYLVMMPFGLLLLWVEMTLLSKLMVAPLPDRPLLMGQFRS